MHPIIFDLVLSGLILGLTYALASEGLWGSALMFFNVLFAGILAFNFYEPLAQLIASNVGFAAGFADCVCMLLIFIVAVVILRVTTETLGPTMVRFPPPVYHIGRVFFAFAGSVVTFAILLLAMECAPVHKKVAGAVDYKYKPPFKQGIDHLWLGFFQYTTGAIFANNNSPKRDPFREYGNARVFDPQAKWLLDHQEARPYGKEAVLGGEGSGEAAAGADGAAGAAGGGASGDVKVIGPAVGGGVVVPQ